MSVLSNQFNRSIRRGLVVSVLLLVFAGGICRGRSVQADQARQIVSGWVKYNQAPMNHTISQAVGDVMTMQEQGLSLCHIVNLQPEGFVILSTETEIEPVIAFSATGSFYADEQNPLTTLLKKDMKGRLEAVELGTNNHQRAAVKAEKWQTLEQRVTTQTAADASAESEDEASSVGVMSEASISDIRVEPFVQSEWSQGDVSGSACYNYYTPNNYVAGCVATAMAQLMRYHTYPTAGIGVHSYTITVDGDSETASTRGGDGAGGAYAWDQMPYDPSSGITTTQRQAIGALCYDAGVTVNMAYTSSSSGASLWDADQELVDTFDYANSIYTQSFSSSGDSRLWNILNANLDAKLPVILGISRSSGGHAVIADGYGYMDETLYHHINMGWGGTDDAWYQLPTIDASYTYTVIDNCIYNVYPSGSGEIISGRVTNAADSPLEGVTVSAYQGTTLAAQATTDSYGVYALTHLASGTTYTMTASQSGETFLDQSVTTGTSADMSTPGNRCGILFVSATTGPPTVYDMDVDIDSGDAVFISLEGLDDGVPDPNWFRCIITSLPSHGILNEPNVGLIDAVPYELTSSIRDVNYISCPYFGGEDSFTYKANDGGTYPTGGDSDIATVTINVNDQIENTFAPSSDAHAPWLFYTSYYAGRCEVLYLADDIGPAQHLTGIALDVYTAPGQTLEDWTIRIKHTSRDDFTSTYYFDTSGWTTVYQADETISATGWYGFEFDTPFVYDGEQNVLIDFSFRNSSLVSGSDGTSSLTDTGDRRILLAYSSSSSASNPLNWTSAPSYSTWIPTCQFVGTSPVDPIVGDFDASCDVKMPDMAVFSQAWLSSEGQDSYNADCDLTTSKGSVDLEDLGILMEQWLQTYAY